MQTQSERLSFYFEIAKIVCVFWVLACGMRHFRYFAGNTNVSKMSSMICKNRLVDYNRRIATALDCCMRVHERMASSVERRPSLY